MMPSVGAARRVVAQRAPRLVLAVLVAARCAAAALARETPPQLRQPDPAAQGLLQLSPHAADARAQLLDTHQYNFDSLIPRATDYCYSRLMDDKTCCMDTNSPPSVVQERVHREGANWTCEKKHGCSDKETGKRGADGLFYPGDATCATPRLVYVHGGSWWYGSPFSEYKVFVSKLAEKTGMAILVPDYPLLPTGKAKTVQDYILTATDWLATHGPRGCTNEVSDAPSIFIGGDSSGGGSALSAMLALQREPERLAGGKQKFAGGFFFSPWTNLLCNTPDYYTKAYATVDRPGVAAGVAHVGDIMFRAHPNENSKVFRDNALQYVGGGSDAAKLLSDPVFSPLFATPELLKGLPPLHFTVGGSETIQGDSVLLAQSAALQGVHVYLDIWPGMWHVFPMYSEGCQNPAGTPLFQGEQAMNRTAFFLQHLHRSGGVAPCPPSRGRPATMHHYGKPAYGWGHQESPATTKEWFPASFCGEALEDTPGPNLQEIATVASWRCSKGDVREGCAADGSLSLVATDAQHQLPTTSWYARPKVVAVPVTVALVALCWYIRVLQDKLQAMEARQSPPKPSDSEQQPVVFGGGESPYTAPTYGATGATRPL